MRLLTLLLTILALACLDGGLGAAVADPIRTGASTLVFSERHPASAYAAMEQRWKWPTTTDYWKQGGYDIAGESFAAYVPADYDGTRPYGLVVGFSNRDEGAVPSEWTPVLDRHALIWVGANQAGFSRNAQARLALALDAVHGMTTRCAIDPRRVSVCGGPGNAGRQANWELITYPDVFTGSIAIEVCDYYVSFPATPLAGMYSGFLTTPDSAPLALARTRRQVLLCGTQSANHLAKMRGAFAAYQADAFHRTSMFEVPDLASGQTPSAAWFERALRFLDRPLRWTSPQGGTLLDTLERAGFKNVKGRFGPGKAIKPALSDLQAKVERGGAPADDAARTLAAVDGWIRAQVLRCTELSKRRPAQAIEELDAFIATVRGLPSEAEAAELVKTLRADADVVQLGKLRAKVRSLLGNLDQQGRIDPLLKAQAALRAKLGELKAAVAADAAVAAEIEEILLDL
ncbi:MAG: hypothetical protein H0W72_14605 [Planctomycetes bacterium]|nr:hypothetical protein [Planctomycetota bacterium]